MRSWVDRVTSTGSQGDRVDQGGVGHSAPQELRGDDVDIVPECRADAGADAGDADQLAVALVRQQIDDEVHVAVGPGVAAGDRAEDPGLTAPNSSSTAWTSSRRAMRSSRRARDAAVIVDTPPRVPAAMSPPPVNRAGSDVVVGDLGAGRRSRRARGRLISRRVDIALGPESGGP